MEKYVQARCEWPLFFIVESFLVSTPPGCAVAGMWRGGGGFGMGRRRGGMLGRGRGYGGRNPFVMLMFLRLLAQMSQLPIAKLPVTMVLLVSLKPESQSASSLSPLPLLVCRWDRQRYILGNLRGFIFLL